MKVLVTGAAGYVGRATLHALRERGHAARALLSPRAPPLPASEAVESLRADLCLDPDLARACEGVGAVVHLAARLAGDADDVGRAAVEGTARLLDAMERAGTRRMVLASSLSVYDWSGGRDVLDEDAPLEPCPERRDGYTTAKLAQERLARERCARAGIALTVLRPGIVWGAGRPYPATVGPHLGPLLSAIGAGRRLPSVHVENCADAFAAALAPAAIGEVFNVVDHPDLTAWRFARDHVRRSGRVGLVVPLPFALGLAAAWVVEAVAPARLRSRLPGLAVPARFEARFRPVRVDGERLRRVLGWRPPLDYAACLDHTYGRAESAVAGGTDGGATSR